MVKVYFGFLQFFYQCGNRVYYNNFSSSNIKKIAFTFVQKQLHILHVNFPKNSCGKHRFTQVEYWKYKKQIKYISEKTKGYIVPCAG